MAGRSTIGRQESMFSDEFVTEKISSGSYCSRNGLVYGWTARLKKYIPHLPGKKKEEKPPVSLPVYK